MPTSTAWRRASGGAAVLLLPMVIYLSLAPGGPSLAPSLSDLAKHGLAYAALGATSGFAAGGWRGAWAAATALTALGFAVELLQPSFGRSYDLKDAAANALGAFAGAGAGAAAAARAAR